MILISALVLGAIQCKIRLHQHGVWPRTARDIGADANADRDVHLVAVKKKRRGKRGLYLCGQCTGTCGIRDLALKHCKLISAQTRDEVRYPRAALETLSDLLEQQVPNRVAKGIVDRLELVKIEIQNCKRLGAALGCGEGLGEALSEGRAICQAGKPVRSCQCGDLLVR